MSAKAQLGVSATGVGVFLISYGGGLNLMISSGISIIVTVIVFAFVNDFSEH
jgi:hypothetical protein